jgi:peptidoglycan L-alanyl-D-glutamate endopeptidase CwlK
MPVLKEGSTGPEVTKLQARLKELGFSPGNVDGNFGPGTEATLIAFQKSEGLAADGIGGPNTMGALGLESGAAAGGSSAGVGSSSGGGSAAASTAPVAGVTVGIVSKMFPGTPVKNIEDNLPIVLQALADAGLGDKDMVLMALGTIRAETASFEPISEGISHLNTDPGSHPFNKYDDRKDLGNKGRPDGASFKGRGFVQLTGRANYQQHGAAIGLGTQLIDDPDLANQPDIAAKLLASFIKSKEQRIRNALLAGDLETARELVNGGKHGLAEFTQAFNTGNNLLA